MNSVQSKLENNNIDQLYRKNRSKSIAFLIILGAVLLLTILLSLRAGSYETPTLELLKGLFGMSADKKINLVVHNNRLPRILTSILAAAVWALPAVFCRLFCAIPWHPPPPLAYPRAPPLALRLPL